MHTETKTSGQLAGVYGLMVEFDQPEQLVEAAQRAHAEGYRHMDAYAPMPVEGLAEAVGFRNNFVQRSVLAAGICGATGGFTLCWWMTVVAYPHIVAGRPLNSWPAYVPITFESMVLLACITAVVGMLMMNGLPQPYHPVFNVKRFERASIDKFFLCIESTDPMFDADVTRQFLARLSSQGVMEVAE